ncbi:MAG TPA: GAF domain-containing sensor histidine kinase [Terriglobia bacterium]|nr:GAF domain-containing sensor histidine kinase [Terriglobia bacterium]
MPLKDSVRARIAELASGLKPHFAAINAAWRARMFEEFELDGRAMAALERLTLGTGFTLFCQADFNTFFENLGYYGTRLSKLKVDTRIANRALELFQAMCEMKIAELYPDQYLEMLAAMEMFSSATFVAVSGSYFDNQRSESTALLSVLDAELSSGSVSSLLDQVVRITANTFGATLGAILLLDDANELQVHASFGLDQVIDENLSIPLGHGFTGNIAQTGEPDILPDIEHSEGVLNPHLVSRAKALWGMPLRTPKGKSAPGVSSDVVIGVLIIGFEKPYQWLPTERELLRAIADRSALAIERARVGEVLREREARIAELSGHLLRVQEEERKRISRELHDETGQALMVIRLYLGMLEQAAGTRARAKIRETVGVVDRTIEGIRRIIGRLSPLVLQELGLVAAIRKEAKDFAKTTGVKARVAVSDEIGRLAPECEAAIYRVVQEALHNVAKHAKATLVNIQMARGEEIVHLIVEDNGQGMNDPDRWNGRSFGLAGMRERVAMLGGTVEVSSTPGNGTRIEVIVPMEHCGTGETIPAEPQPAPPLARGETA